MAIVSQQPVLLCLIRSMFRSPRFNREPVSGVPTLPVNVRHREIASESVSPGIGVECFDAPDAVAINLARLSHRVHTCRSKANRFSTLRGVVGHWRKFFVQRKCRVVCLDGRAENIQSLQQRYPARSAPSQYRSERPGARRLGWLSATDSCTIWKTRWLGLKHGGRVQKPASARDHCLRLRSARCVAP